MHDLHCKNADEMYSEVLAQRVTELKETEEGSESMCEALEKLVQEFVQEGELRGETRGEARGIAKGETKKAKETAKSLSKEGMSAEKIAQVLGEDEETIRNWLAHEQDYMKMVSTKRKS